MSGKIRVTTQKLRGKKESFHAAATLATEDFTAACREGGTLTACFEAQAAETIQKMFLSCMENGKDSFKQIEAQISKLEEIATIYEKTEGGNRLVEGTGD